MNARLVLPALALLVLSLSGCNSGTTPVPTSSPLKEPEDPLVEVVKALPMDKVRVELVCSQPAGEANTTTEYVCTILARFTVANRPETGYTIQRVVLQAEFKKEYDGFAFKQGVRYSKAGGRNVALRCTNKGVSYAPGGMSGTSTRSGGFLRPGTALTFDPSESSKQLLSGNPHLIKSQVQARDVLALIGVGEVLLDDLVKPLFKGPEIFDLPKTVELLQIGDQKTTLEIGTP
jgi:hypothetical protein